MRTIRMTSGEDGGTVRVRDGEADEHCEEVEVQRRLFTTRIVRYGAGGKRLGSRRHVHPTAKLFWAVFLLGLTYALAHFGVIG